MSQFRKSLIEELMLTLKIPQGNFNYSTIEDEIRHISNDNLKEFYKSVMSADSFGNGMKAIIESSKKFKPQEQDLFAGTRQQAKDMYSKFYKECCKMLDHCTANRDKISSDREFFKRTDYRSLKRTDGSKTYTKQDIYVLNNLGGGEWLCDIRLYPNSEVAVKKIEKSINDAITTKYSTNAIANKKVKSLIGCRK